MRSLTVFHNVITNYDAVLDGMERTLSKVR